MLAKETRQTIRELLDCETFEITDAKGAIRNLLTELDKAEKEIERLHKEYELYRKALEFYADQKNWTEGEYRWIEYPEVTFTVAEQDGGYRAIQALKGESK